MLPEIVAKFLAEVLGCLTDHFVLLKTVDMVLDVLDGGEHHVDGRVVLAIEEVSHLLDGLEQGQELLHEGEVVLGEHQVIVPVTCRDDFVEGPVVLLVDTAEPLHHVHIGPPASHHLGDHVELDQFVQFALGIYRLAILFDHVLSNLLFAS